MGVEITKEFGKSHYSQEDFAKRNASDMGGIGSGRRNRSGRGKVEERRSLDVNRLHKGGSLQPRLAGAVHWTRDGEKVATINLRAEADRVHLSYRVQVGQAWQEVDEKVRIGAVPCPFWRGRVVGRY